MMPSCLRRPYVDMMWTSVLTCTGACAGMIVVLLLAAIVTLPASAQQDDGNGGSFLTPFPESDTYRMVVIGDTFAEGIISGLQESFGPETRLEVPRKHRQLTGLTRNEFDDEIKWLEDPAQAKEPIHLAVVMVGVGDRRTIRTQSGKQAPVGSGDWLDFYGRRIDRVVKALKKRRIAVYWVGLPVVKKGDWSDDYSRMNDVIREKAFLNGQKYIDVYQGFADDTGNFDTYGPDLTGKMRKMREGDGILFTADGNRKLAHYVEREVKRDLTQARTERSIPLLGSDEEQKRATPRQPKTAAAVAAGASAAGTPVSGASPRSFVIAPAPSRAVEPGAEQLADNSRISLRVLTTQGKEETIVMDLPRPAIAANVMALVTRQQTADKPAQVGDAVTDEIAGGVLVLSSITPVSVSGRRTLSPTQAPYFRVLVKGERLNPKIGRVDDFTWPRAAEPEPVAPVAAPAPAPAVAPVQPKRATKPPPRS